ncbi:type I restriction-modification system [Geminocystis sp. NIES-3708]|nr:type I restriction-modification system [Geminocystis sp. NIES-3708]
MSFGRPYIMKTSGCIHYGWLVLKDKSGLFDQDYLYYFLGSNTTYKQFDNLAAGSTVRNLNTTPIQKVEIVIPPLEVQKRIVEILDEAFEGIDRAIALSKQNLLNAHELFDSYLNNIFTNKGDDWVEKKLGDICQNLDSKRIPITKSQRKKGNIPYYGASGIVDYVEGYIFDENLLLISDENLLLISEDGANLLARTYPIAFSISGKTWVNNHAHVLKFKSINLQKFIEYYFNSISLKPYVTGMAQPKLNQTTLNSIIVPFPSEKYCQNIVNKLDKLSTEVKRLEEIYQKKVALVNEGMIERGKK